MWDMAVVVDALTLVLARSKQSTPQWQVESDNSISGLSLKNEVSRLGG